MHFIVFSSSSLFVKQTRSYRHCDSGFKEWDSMLYNGEVKWSEVAQLCPTLCDSVNCSLPGSSIHGIFQAGVLEWDAISLSRGSSWPRDQTQASRTVGRRFTVWATREVVLGWGLWVEAAGAWAPAMPPCYNASMVKMAYTLQPSSVLSSGLPR